jgi:hypothetical protein
MSSERGRILERTPTDVVDRIRVLASEGLTAAAIGNEVGRSRNSIIGLCFRHHISLQTKGRPRAEKPAPRPASARTTTPPRSVRSFGHWTPNAPKAKRPAQVEPVVEALPPEPVVDKHVGIGFAQLDRLFEKCRRPLWHGRAPPAAQQRYCGREVVKGRSWCAVCLPGLTSKSFVPPKWTGGAR